METPVKKRRITKKELEELLALKKKLVKSKERAFAKISEGAKDEVKHFQPCEKCKFLSRVCHKTCGIAMKWLHKEGKLDISTGIGNGKRLVTEKEYTDTSSVNLGLSEEVDRVIAEEVNSDSMGNDDGIMLGELDSYEIGEDE